ncbi:MAG: GDSL-type esterase/lipase family protein [Fuerstiella sp.]|nr:GDSL-type esterase/lipase family protein [Fuerstiella sp.]
MRSGTALCFSAILTTITTVASVARSDQPILELKPDDHVAFIGNTLADRMQHDGWLETHIQAVFPTYDLVFRNLGYPGDELKQRSRADNFGSPDQWLTKVKADVIFGFFGYNEAFRGEGGLTSFRENLAEILDGMLQHQYNGRSAPRIVMFSPIAHEDLKSPHLPDGSANNHNLQLYTDAMQTVCADRNIAFVDLFHPTLEMYSTVDEPLTLNGIHLLEHGNKKIAEHIVGVLFGEAARIRKSSAEWLKLRNAVLDKNLHWFSRYRVVDEYNVFGGRSRLAWFGQSNGDVMMREMEIFDIMTATRDQRIWAIAQGSGLTITDDNLPETLVVKTNKPGPLEGDKFEYLSPQGTAETMKLAEGLEVNVFASEEMFPEMINPVQMAVDTDGRLFVSVWPSYPHWNPTKARRDRILCLPDEDGDGVADECRVFADKLNSVTGIEFWGGGLLVAAPPEIWFLKDTDGDDTADVRIRMLQGVSSADTHHSANAMLIGTDGGLYWSRGIFNVASMETPTGTYRSGRSGVHRFDPRTFEMSFVFPIGPNPHGHVMDQWGYHFANDGTSGTGSYINIGNGESNKQWFKKRVRPVAATGILSSSHFPDDMQGNFLICNCIGVLGVLQHEVHYNGADITAKEVEPILLADDPNFRPTDVEIGGDGALYVSDWSNALIGHMQHNMRDPNRDDEHGRIYRLTAKGRPLVETPKLKGKSIVEVCQAFYAKENNVRYRARLELSGRNSEAISNQVGHYAAKLDSQDPEDAQALLECLWVFEEHRIPNPGLLETVYQAKEPRVRAAAIRTLGNWATKISDWKQLLSQAAVDKSALVRAEAVKAAVSFGGLDAAEAVLTVFTGPTDPELDTVLKYAREKLKLDNIIRDAIASRQPLSDVARAYALRHASTTDLLTLSPDADLYNAVLSRPDASTKALRNALVGLADIHRRDHLPLLLDLIEQHDAANGDLRSLKRLLVQVPPADLGAMRKRLEALAANGRTSVTRQAALAAWILADGSADDVWLATSKNVNSIKDFLNAVPDITDDKLRGSVFTIVQSQLHSVSDAQSDSLTDVAVQALAAVPGHDKARVSELAALMKAGRSRAHVVQTLLQIPVEEWPQSAVRPMADNLAGYLTSMPTSRRTGEQAMKAVRLAKSLVPRLAKSDGKALLERLKNLDVRVIAIGTVPARMIYDKEILVVEAGKPVEFRFSNSDHMPHNLAIVQPGTMQEIGEQAEATARDADAIQRHYIPNSDKVMLASRLLQPGETQALSFDVPETPGVYPYVCTYPGHWRRMFGALYVLASLEEYQAAPETYLTENPLPIKDNLLEMANRNHEWTVAELVSDIKSLKNGRSFEVGKQLFKVASCAACHQLNNEGRVFGPDLAKLEPKKRTAEHLLESMIDPSKQIDDRFRSWIFVMTSGKTVTGMIMKETDDEVHVVIDPLAKNKPTVLKQIEIDERIKSSTSLMPKSLLNRLTQEDIFDLFAYVISAGDRKHMLFHGRHDH